MRSPGPQTGRPAWPGVAESGALALVVTVALIGAWLVPLATPVYVRSMVSAVGAPELAGLEVETTLQVAEQVRRFVVDPQAPPLPPTVAGRPGFDAAAVSHLVDVRVVLAPARWLALGVLVLAAVWIAVRVRDRSGREAVARGLSIAGWTVLAATLAAAALGVADFDALFAWFHSLFFADGTWQFTADALLIQVFPLPFWITSAALWGAGMVTAAVACVLAARRIRFTALNNGV